jgi:Tfp pilus assembly protein FimT
MTTKNRGFTLIELLIICSIISILSLVSLPKVSSAISKLGVGSAKQEVASYLAQARALAIQNGRAARFIRTGSKVTVALESGGQLVPLAGVSDYARDYKVSLETYPDTIRFDPRGFASGITAAAGYQYIRLTRGALRDSVCVSRLGRITSRGGCS